MWWTVASYLFVLVIGAVVGWFATDRGYVADVEYFVEKVIGVYEDIKAFIEKIVSKVVGAYDAIKAFFGSIGAFFGKIKTFFKR